MLHDLLIEGKLVNPEALLDVQIGIDNGHITAIKKWGLRGRREIDARRGLIFPGFIDLHAHLREDSSHKWDYKENFESGSAAALHGGITTVIDMPNTPLPGINSERIREKKELARKKSKGLIDIFFCGGVAESNLHTLAEMRKEVAAYKIYLSETTGRLNIPGELLPTAIKAVEATAKPVIIHCEDQKILDKRKEELKVKGDIHDYSELRPEDAELAAVKSVLSSATSSRKTKIDIAHVSTFKTLEYVRRRNRVHCEVTPHHLFFNRDDLREKALLKTNPPVRTEENRLQLLNGLKSGTIDFLATDHAPHTKEEKARGLLQSPAGVPNLDTYGNVVSWLIVCCDVHPTVIARVCSYNPSIFLGLNDRGRIEVGKRANLTILDLQKRVKISSERLYTNCGWSPFEGYEFTGAVMHTIFNGILVSEYDDVYTVT
jgi:dihydroorotase